MPMLNSELDPAQVRQAIEAEAKALGFDAFGVAGPDSVPELPERLNEYLAAGHHATMGWMEERKDVRSAPLVMWPEMQSVIAVGMNYGPGQDPRALLGHADRANISVYARGRDYHDVLKKRLKALARFMASQYDCALKVFVDTAPVMEKPLAAAAGLGWQGKHTNLVSREFGSWLFLGVLYTELKVAPDNKHRDQCGSCRACLDACPTGAFPSERKIDAGRCISYLTIEHHGPIPEEFRPMMGNRIYGCDDCLAACPWNKFAVTASEAAFHARVELNAPRLADLLTLDDPDFRQFFSGSPIKRIGRNRFIRNCLIAAGNSKDQRLLSCVQGLKNDPDPVVVDAAIWAEKRLQSQT